MNDSSTNDLIEEKENNAIKGYSRNNSYQTNRLNELVHIFYVQHQKQDDSIFQTIDEINQIIQQNTINGIHIYELFQEYSIIDILFSILQNFDFSSLLQIFSLFHTIFYLESFTSLIDDYITDIFVTKYEMIFNEKHENKSDLNFLVQIQTILTNLLSYFSLQQTVTNDFRIYISKKFLTLIEETTNSSEIQNILILLNSFLEHLNPDETEQNKIDKKEIYTNIYNVCFTLKYSDYFMSDIPFKTLYFVLKSNCFEKQFAIEHESDFISLINQTNIKIYHENILHAKLLFLYQLFVLFSSHNSEDCNQCNLNSNQLSQDGLSLFQSEHKEKQIVLPIFNFEIGFNSKEDTDTEEYDFLNELITSINWGEIFNSCTNNDSVLLLTDILEIICLNYPDFIETMLESGLINQFVYISNSTDGNFQTKQAVIHSLSVLLPYLPTTAKEALVDNAYIYSLLQYIYCYISIESLTVLSILIDYMKTQGQKVLHNFLQLYHDENVKDTLIDAIENSEDHQLAQKSQYILETIEQIESEINSNTKKKKSFLFNMTKK